MGLALNIYWYSPSFWQIWTSKGEEIKVILLKNTSLQQYPQREWAAWTDSCYSSGASASGGASQSYPKWWHVPPNLWHLFILNIRHNSLPLVFTYSDHTVHTNWCRLMMLNDSQWGGGVRVKSYQHLPEKFRETSMVVRIAPWQEKKRKRHSSND